MAIVGVGHVALRCRDIEETVAFYAKLGIPEAFRMRRADGSPGGPVFLKVAPGSFLELFAGGVKAPEESRTRAAFVHLCLHVDDIHGFYATLKADGIATNGEPRQGRAGNWSFTLRDPNGLPLEIVQLEPGTQMAEAAG